MFSIEIVKGVEDSETSQIRIDVAVEIPGLYREVIPYAARVSDVKDPAEATRVMDEARQHAKNQAQAALDAWVLRRAAELQPTAPEATRKRPGRPRKSAPVSQSDVAIIQEITQGHPPLDTSGEEAPIPGRDSELTTVLEQEMARATKALGDSIRDHVGEPMDRKPEHEAILRDLLVESYGPNWAQRPDVKSAAMQMATHAIANGVLCRDIYGQPHSQIRALYGEMVVQRCPA